MPLFPNIDALEAYVDAVIIANGNNEISGPDNNTALNGCIEFIRQSPLNWEKSDLISGGGVVVVSQPVTVFMTTTPTSITWGDNIYNEFVFVNMTANAIPFASGKVYYDSYGSPISSLAPNQSIDIVKAQNDLWVQVGSSLPFPLNNSTPDNIEFVVSNLSFMVIGQTTATIPQFIGYNLFMGRNGIVQYTIDAGDGDTRYTWNKNTGVFTCTALLEFDKIILIPTTGRGFVLQPGTTPFYPFLITSSDFESDGVTYNDPSIAGMEVSLWVNDFTGNFLSNGKGINLTSTGFVVTAVGFNANDFDYTIQVSKIN